MPLNEQHFTDIAEAMLQSVDLESILNDNDLTDEDVLVHLIQCGLIEVPDHLIIE